jgi:hypothetical protein
MKWHQAWRSIPHWLHREALDALLAPQVTHSHAGAGLVDDLRIIPMPKTTSTMAMPIAIIEDPISFAPHWKIFNMMSIA